jgi:hypothetical protein
MSLRDQRLPRRQQPQPQRCQWQLDDVRHFVRVRRAELSFCSFLLTLRSNLLLLKWHIFLTL